jgi:hypothetical protein
MAINTSDNWLRTETKPSPIDLSRVASSTTLVSSRDLKKIGTQNAYQASMQIFGAIKKIPIKIDEANGPSAIKSFSSLDSNNEWISIKQTTSRFPFSETETVLFDRLSKNESGDGFVLQFKKIGEEDGILMPGCASPPIAGRPGGTVRCRELQEITWLYSESERVSNSVEIKKCLLENLEKSSQAIIKRLSDIETQEEEVPERLKTASQLIATHILEYVPFLTPGPIPRKLSHRLPAQLILPRKEDCCSLF